MQNNNKVCFSFILEGVETSSDEEVSDLYHFYDLILNRCVLYCWFFAQGDFYHKSSRVRTTGATIHLLCLCLLLNRSICIAQSYDDYEHVFMYMTAQSCSNDHTDDIGLTSEVIVVAAFRAEHT